MSGIAGALEPGNRPPDLSALKRMLDTLAHRGPDGTSVWGDGGVALGHCQLKTSSEPAHATIFRSGALVITADARLDNREELADELSLPCQDLSDEALLLASYCRWGEASPAKLLGDFAFAIWDEDRRVLFCARDHFGVRPFYYWAGPTGFRFASEVKALFALPEVPRQIEEARIADFLAGLPTDEQMTAYRGVFRLPPRHCLSVSEGQVSLSEYWKLEPSEFLSGDRAEQFLALFTSAVRSRIRGTAPAGALLSGGLDSSSVAAVAAPIVAGEPGRRLETISAVFDETPAWNERPFIEAVAAKTGLSPWLVSADRDAPFGELDRMMVEQDGAFPAPGLAITYCLYEAARHRGVRILLDGHGGDEVVSHGAGRLAELARDGRWLALWQAAQGISHTYGEPTWPRYAAYVRRYGPSGISRLLRLVTHLRQGHLPRNEEPGWGSFIRSEFAARSDLAERFRALQRREAEAAGSERLRHGWVLTSPRISQSFEILDKTAAFAGIETRYPFWDRRLVEFCLSLRPEEKLDGDWPRLVLRRAMEGILPPSVQWRRDKLDFRPHLVRGLLDHQGCQIERLLAEDHEGIGAFVDLQAIRSAYDRIVEKAEMADGRDLQAVWRTVVLAAWLRQSVPIVAGAGPALEDII